MCPPKSWSLTTAMPSRLKTRRPWKVSASSPLWLKANAIKPSSQWRSDIPGIAKKKGAPGTLARPRRLCGLVKAEKRTARLTSPFQSLACTCIIHHYHSLSICHCLWPCKTVAGPLLKLWKSSVHKRKDCAIWRVHFEMSVSGVKPVYRSRRNSEHHFFIWSCRSCANVQLGIHQIHSSLSLECPSAKPSKITWCGSAKKQLYKTNGYQWHEVHWSAGMRVRTKYKRTACLIFMRSTFVWSLICPSQQFHGQEWWCFCYLLIPFVRSAWICGACMPSACQEYEHSELAIWHAASSKRTCQQVAVSYSSRKKLHLTRKYQAAYEPLHSELLPYHMKVQSAKLITVNLNIYYDFSFSFPVSSGFLKGTSSNQLLRKTYPTKCLKHPRKQRYQKESSHALSSLSHS